MKVEISRKSSNYEFRVEDVPQVLSLLAGYLLDKVDVKIINFEGNFIFRTSNLYLGQKYIKDFVTSNPCLTLNFDFSGCKNCD